MADKDAEKTEADQGKGGLGMKDIVIMALSALLLVGLSVAGTTIYLGTKMPMAATDAVGADGETMDPENKKMDGKIPETVAYQSLDPAFVVNFQEDDELHFLQIKMEVMTYEDSVIEDVRMHMPAIRNDLVLLLSKQSYTALNTEMGKEKLRVDALTAVRNVLKQYTGNAGVEAVYFTSFVMQ